MAPPNDNTTTTVTTPQVSREVAIESKDESKTSEKIVDHPPTEMIYYTYDGCFEYECDALITYCQLIDEGQDSNDGNSRNIQFSLNRTILHAQGGGQPTDFGIVKIDTPASESTATNETPGQSIEVTKVLLDRSTGVANHTGRLLGSSKDLDSRAVVEQLIGQPVHVTVDVDRRKILSECHTAGHVVDSAMAKCNKTLPALKGYHFLDGPYVEYKGTIPAEEREELLKQLQQAFVELVDEDIPTKIDNLCRGDAQSLCDRVAENYFNLQEQFPDDTKDVRIVTVAGWPCPCGGTHVASTGELKKNQWGITGFRNKKGVFRVKYNMNWMEAK